MLLTRRRPTAMLAAAVLVATLASTLAVVPASAAFVNGAAATHTLATTTLQPASDLAATTACSSLLSLQAKATLSWTPTPSTWATGYQLERWKDSTLEATSTVTPASATGVTEDGLDTATTYTWRLRAYFASWISAEVSVTATTPAPCLL